jgi:hypothetical protein
LEELIDAVSKTPTSELIKKKEIVLFMYLKRLITPMS